MAKGAAHPLLKSAVIVAKILSVGHIVFTYVGFPTQVDGPSMFPTFIGRGEWVVAEALPGLADRVRVGDIVISTRPIAVSENIIKRVTAVAGEHVSVFERGRTAPLRVKVPPGHVWLQGDNLLVSRDSREYGPVPLALLRGRVVAQVWPTLKWI